VKEFPLREYVVKLAWAEDPTVVSHVIVKARTLAGACIIACAKYECSEHIVLDVLRKETPDGP